MMERELTLEDIAKMKAAFEQVEVEWRTVESHWQAIKMRWREHRIFGRQMQKWKKGDKYIMAWCTKGFFYLPESVEYKPQVDPVASAYVRRIRNECDGLVEYLHSRGDQINADKGDRVAARIYKPLRQVDGIINGFKDEQ